MKAQSILLEFFKFFIVDIGLAGHDVDAIVGDSKLFLAIIFDGIILIQIDNIVISLVYTEFFHELSLDISG